MLTMYLSHLLLVNIYLCNLLVNCDQLVNNLEVLVNESIEIL